MTTRSFTVCCAAVIAMLCGLTAPAQADQGAPTELNIPAQPLRDALAALGRQTGLQVVYTASEVAENLTAPRLVGTYSPGDALTRLLSNTGLRYEYLDERTIAIRTAAASAQPADAVSTSQQGSLNPALRMARVNPEDPDAAAGRKAAPGSEADVEDTRGVPEILVKGSRTSNTDIRRTKDDVQPYVVFDAEDIGRSMAPDLDTLLRTRLPMNQSRGSEGQRLSSTRGNQSTINLRGLGSNQTLILVNGRRMPGVPSATDSGQPDINGIPISAVERIEILPSTAGGLYGGGATGGVVNIILKRNYNDLELTARYDGTFAGGGAQRRLDATAGFTVEGGRTNVMITGSHRNSNPLYIGHRHFSARAWALADQNNHATFLAQSNPVHGYTTNVRSVNGSDLVLKDGMVSLDSPIAHVPVGYAGPASDNGAAFLGTADEYNLMPANDVLGNLFSLLPTPRVRSLQLSVRREFTDRIEAFVDAARYDNYSVRMGSTAVDNLVNITLAEGPNNPFDQAVRLSVPLVGYDTGRLRVPSMSISDQLAGGVIVRLPREWTVQGEYALGRSEWVYQFPRDLLSPEGTAALLDGRLDPLSDVNAYPLDFSSFYSETDARISGAFRAERESAVLRVSGPLFQLPGGPLRVAGLLERREQFNGDAIQATYPLGGGAPVFTYYGKAGSMTESGYAELNAPLVSSANARPGLLALDLRASYRYDTTDTRAINNDNFVPVPSPDGPFPDLPYQTNSVTGNQYTLGFRYTPVQNVTLRLSYGEGILPPAFGQLGEFEFPPAFLSFNRDPKRGGLPVNITTIERFTVLGSLQLRPERSASWSGGMIFTPAHLPGFRVSVDYTRIEKTDEIGSLGTQTLLDLEDDFLGVIVRNELTAADAALGYTGGTIRVFNAGPVNVARTLMEAFDIQADYRWETRFGSFAANVLAAVQPRLSLKATPGGDEVNRVGYSNGPLKWRGSAGVNWSRGPLDLGWNLQYYDASRVYTSTNSTTVRNNAVLTQGSEWIPTQTYNDVYGRYRFENASDFVGGLLENTELQVSVQNLFNTSPPILASSSSFTVAGYATEGDPRLRRYSIAFTKRFGR